MARTLGFKNPIAEHHDVSWAHGERTVRIAHLTDLHFGLVTPLDLLRAAVRVTNESQPDLVVLTGDFVSRGRGHIRHIPWVLGELEAPAVAVLGNHDHWVDASAVRNALEAAGIEVLTNRSVVRHGVRIVGIDDFGTQNHDLDRATDGVDEPFLALSHNPEAAPLLWERGAKLVLSGHTHAGQVHHPQITPWAFERFMGERFLAGWYHDPRGSLYVNPGLGSSAFPWRIGRASHRRVAVHALQPVAPGQ